MGCRKEKDFFLLALKVSKNQLFPFLHSLKMNYTMKRLLKI